MWVWWVRNYSVGIDAMGDGPPALLLPSVNSGPLRGRLKENNNK